MEVGPVWDRLGLYVRPQGVPLPRPSVQPSCLSWSLQNRTSSPPTHRCLGVGVDGLYDPSLRVPFPTNGPVRHPSPLCLISPARPLARSSGGRLVPGPPLPDHWVLWGGRGSGGGPEDPDAGPPTRSGHVDLHSPLLPGRPTRERSTRVANGSGGTPRELWVPQLAFSLGPRLRWTGERRRGIGRGRVDHGLRRRV